MTFLRSSHFKIETMIKRERKLSQLSFGQSVTKKKGLLYTYLIERAWFIEKVLSY